MDEADLPIEPHPEQSAAGRARYTNPVDRYTHLPDHVKIWLERQTPESLALLTEFMVSLDRARWLGRISRRLLIAIVGGASAALLLGKQIAEWWHVLTGR